jgi:hypothetical protein
MRLAFAREYWFIPASAVIALIVLSAIVLPLQQGQFMRGLVVGLLIGGLGVGTVAFIAAASGSTAVTFGAWAERWTSEELQPMRAHGYQLVNRARLGYGDLDHVLIGPGGVFVFETKWSAQAWNVEKDPTAARALSQLKRAADQLERWLQPRVEVTRVLVLWSGAAAQLARARRHEISGTTVIAGKDVQRWLLNRGRGSLMTDDIEIFHARLVDQTRARDAHDPLAMPAPLRTLWSTALAGFLGLFVPAVVGQPGGLWGICVSAASIVAAGVLARRDPRLRLPAVAAMTPAVAWLLLVLAALLLD